MIVREQLRGVCAAVITPIDAEHQPDPGRAIPYYRELLERGCDALNVLGTTGEAMSFNADQRVGFMQAIATSGLPRERMMVGTGASSLADAIRQTSAAMELGFGAALVMPPFYFRGIADDGVVRFFDALISHVRPRPEGIFLYNFPAMSGITFHADLVDRLMLAHPGIIGGIKDSSNDAQLQRDIVSRHPELRVYPGSELHLSDARERGCAGCISGSVALWPEIAARVWSGQAGQSELTALRESLSGAPLIPQVRRRLAQAMGDPAWERSVPPL
jgi:4-hydroxy-tetrahydrodipicolinate synthase